MKKLLSILALSIGVIACSSNRGMDRVNSYNTDGMELTGKYITYQGDTIATMVAFEAAYDNGGLVHEVTFVLDDVKNYSQAYTIIKYIHEHKPEWDVEVQVEYVEERF